MLYLGYLKELNTVSAIASLYVMDRKIFDKYCAMADMHAVIEEGSSESVETQNDSDGKNQILVPVYVTPAKQKSPEFQAKMQHYKNIYNFLVQNSKEPYIYNWSGYVLYELMKFLKDEKQIDLLSKSFQDTEGMTELQLLDTEVKQKYLQKLDPANFSENELATEYLHSTEQFEEEVWKKMAAAMAPEKMKQMMAMRAKMPQSEEFPERGEAMLDGIKIIHDCLKLVDETTVVMVVIG